MIYFFSSLNGLIQSLRYRFRLKTRWILFANQFKFAYLKKKLKKKDVWTVVFFAMGVSFWKYDRLFQLMLAHPRFKPIIVFATNPKRSPEIQEEDEKAMQVFFEKQKYPYAKNLGVVVPDIIFYTQPYSQSVIPEYRIGHFSNALICYTPYSFWISNYRWGYNSTVLNQAWKLFYPTQIHLENAKKLMYNKGKNVTVTGYALADNFLDPNRKPIDNWKIKDSIKKKIIWAAHLSVLPESPTHNATFFDYCDLFLNLAEKYQDLIQIAFKPHPILKNNLYIHPHWGKEKTDAYYARWESMSNTTLINGSYEDLFLTSDALIHDCGSFAAEYLYTKKPVLYIGQELETNLCPFGKKAIKAHYIAKTSVDVENFLTNVIFMGNDPKKEIRDKIFKTYLLPPHHKTAAQNMMDSICQSLS